MAKLRPLKTFEQVIDVLGGTSKAAIAAGRTPSQVCQWRERHGTFPAELWPRLRDALAKRGYEAPESLFRFECVG